MTSDPFIVPPRPAPIFMLPPPLYFVVAFGAGVLVQRVLPLGFHDFPGRFAIGFVLLLAGMAVGPTSSAIFVRRGTTLNPFAAPTVLVTGGMYRLTRNPMYLGLTIFYLGGCLLVSSLWPAVLLIVPLAILNQAVIPYEEASMRQAFGEAYSAYCVQVRRWL